MRHDTEERAASGLLSADCERRAVAPLRVAGAGRQRGLSVGLGDVGVGAGRHRGGTM